MSALLDLLEREATPEDYERLAAALPIDAPAFDVPDDVAASVGAGSSVALCVRLLLERRRLRDAHTALFDIANDLASLQDVDAVLRTIVAHARRLLHTDVATLSLLEEGGTSTYIRMAIGTVSPKLRDLRLDVGVGIGGAVAIGREPFQTSNYYTDPRLQHDAVVDDAVRAEGLVAILGVPMLVSGELIGVLLAADRAERVFRADEVTLLASLATHAALAIEKTRLLQNAQVAVADLSRANEEIRVRSAKVEQAADAHERMTELVLRGGGIDDVAAAVVGVLGGTLLVTDVDGSEMTRVGPGVLPDGWTELVGLHDGAARVRSSEFQGWLVAPVVAGTEQFGLLLYKGDVLVGDAERRIVERAAMVTALLLVWRRSVAVAEIRGRGDVLRDILAGTADARSVGERARLLGVDLDVPSCVVVLRAPTGAAALLSAAVRITPLSGALIGEFDGDVIVVAPGEQPLEAAGRLVRQLSQLLDVPLTGAGAGPASGAAELRTAHVEARRCVGALIALGRAGEVADRDELGFLGLLIGPDRDVREHIRRRLGPVLDYDHSQGTGLIDSLETYFEQEQSLTRAAKVLHIHVNTMAQRLDRIGILLGPEWRTPKGTLEVRMALELLRVTRARVLD